MYFGRASKIKAYKDGIEEAVEWLHIIQKVNIADQSKHNGQNKVQYHKIKEILQHFANNLDQWTNLLIVLENGRNSQNKTRDNNCKQILNLEVMLMG